MPLTGTLVNWAWPREKNSEFEGMSIKTSQTVNKKKQNLKNEYLRTVEEIQEV